MLQCGIEYLGDKEPFFIMCEGGDIDWGGHGNKIMPVVSTVIEFDNSIKAALEFYKKHPKETLIVVTADHGTGGVSLGCGGWGRDKIHWDIIEKAWTEAGMCNEMSLEENKELNESATIGWSGVYHTGEHVPVFAIGKGAERFSGKMDNTEIKSKILCIE
jgi:alkaline phosphatase